MAHTIWQFWSLLRVMGTSSESSPLGKICLLVLSPSFMDLHCQAEAHYGQNLPEAHMLFDATFWHVLYPLVVCMKTLLLISNPEPLQQEHIYVCTKPVRALVCAVIWDIKAAAVHVWECPCKLPDFCFISKLSAVTAVLQDRLSSRFHSILTEMPFVWWILCNWIELDWQLPFYNHTCKTQSNTVIRHYCNCKTWSNMFTRCNQTHL